MSRPRGKLQGGAGLHGGDYQIKLYMLFLLKGYIRKNHFRLSAENKDAGKFDDLVFQEDHETILLQAKHKDNINKKISLDQFFADKGEFSLRKYFESFLEICSNFSSNTSYVICTNIDINNEVSDKFTKRIEIATGSVLSNYKITGAKQYFYSFDTDELMVKFKEQISNADEKEIKSFLKNLQLVILADDDVKQTIMKILENVLNFDKRLKKNIVYDFFYNKLKKWFGETKLTYLTPLHLESYLSEMLSTLFLENLQKHKHEVIFSDLPLTSNKQITIINTTRYLLLMLKLLEQFSTDPKENILFVDPQLGPYQKTMINVFQLTHYTKLICCVVGENKNTLISVIEKLLPNIATKAYKQIFILTDNDIFLDSSTEIQAISDTDFLRNIKLNNANEETEVENEELYINRYLIDEINTYTEEELLKRALNEESKIFLISDIAGMGKSSTLSFLTHVIKTNFNNLLVKEINLNSYTSLFQTCLKRRKALELDELLNFQHKIGEFEKQIISIPETLILMLDGLDEISYEHRELVTTFIQDSISRLTTNKIFMTARPQLEGSITKTLSVKIYRFKPLTKTEQYRMIFFFWVRNLQITDEEQKKKCLEYGEMVLKNLSTLLPDLNILIGVPLIVKMLSEIFEPQVEKYCRALNENEPNKLFDNFNLAVLYDMFIERKKEIYIEEKSNAQGNKLTTKIASEAFNSLLVECTSLALMLIFPEEVCKFFGIRPLSVDTSDSLCDTGLITYSNEDYQFIHRTFAEYLVANRLFAEIKNSEESRIKFLIRNIFISNRHSYDGKYVGVHRFLNSILENEKNDIDPKIYKIWGGAIAAISSYSTNLDVVLIPWNFINILHLLFDKCNTSNAILMKYVNFSDEPLLHTATMYGAMEVVKFLTEKGVGVDAKNNRGETALHKSVSSEYFHSTKLIEMDATIKEAKNDNFETVKYLVQQGANINAQDNNGVSVLHKAAANYNSRIVKYLLDNCADVNVVDNDAESVLHVFSFNFRENNELNMDILSSIEYILQKGANLNVKNKHGMSVLHTYVESDFCPTEYIEFLVSKGAEINAKNNVNDSILHTSVSKNRCYIKYLIENGADINAVNDRRESILHSAVLRIKSETNGSTKYLVSSLIHSGPYVNSTDVEGQSILHSAVLFGDDSIVQNLVENGANINAVDNQLNSVLHLAVSCPNRKMTIVQYLVEKYASVNALDKDGRSVLHSAIQFDNKEIINYLLEHGANVNVTNNSKESVLHSAAFLSDVDVVQSLVEKGAIINAVDNQLKSVLHIAVSSPYRKMYLVRYLVNNGADVFAVDKHGHSVLHSAVQFRNREILVYLIENGANVNATGNSEESVLHVAAFLGDIDIMQTLVEKGANINAVDNELKSVLHIAVSSPNRKTNLVQYLVERGANINAVDKYGESVLCSSVRFGNREIINYLIKSNAAVNVLNNTIKSALHSAILVKDFRIIQALIENGVNVNAVDKDGESVLQFALQFANEQIVNCLIQHGANVNAANNSKESILHSAVRFRCLSIIKSLIEKGANVNAVDKDGESVLHFAIRFGNKEIMNYLIDHGANLNVWNNSKESILVLSIYTGDTCIIETLVEKGADINAVNKDDESALHFAVQLGNEEIVNYLIEHGANVNALNCSKEPIIISALLFGNFHIFKALIGKGADVNAMDKNGKSILHYALERNKEQIVNYLIERGANVGCIIEIDGNRGYSLNDEAFAEERSEKSSLDLILRKRYIRKIEASIAKGEKVNAVDKEGDPVLGSAILIPSSVIANYLLENGANPNTVYNNASVLHIAVRMEDISIIQTLIEKGANVNAVDKNGEPILLTAIRTGTIRIIETLIKKGANVNTVNKAGMPILTSAILADNIEIVNSLLQNGANANALYANDAVSESVLRTAIRIGNLRVIQALVENGANVNYFEKHGEPVLATAVLIGNVEIVRYFLEHGANANISYNNDSVTESVLHTAVRLQIIEIIEALIENGADVNAKDERGLTVLQIARAAKDKHIINLLDRKGARKNLCEVM